MAQQNLFLENSFLLPLKSPKVRIQEVVTKKTEHRTTAFRQLLWLAVCAVNVGRKETVPLNEAVLQGKADTTDYPGLLSDVLDGLLSMTDENWQERCDELAKVLRPVILAG